MPDVTSAQREEIIRTLIECREGIAQAGAAHLGLEGYMNFELARAVIHAALQVFESVEYPREATVAAGHLQSARAALQEFNNGVAAESISVAQKQIEECRRLLTD